MFRNYLDKIERDEDVRKNLIELRNLLKTEPGSAAWQRDRQRCLSLMLKLLKHEDAKVRKNAALILGEMGCQDALDALFYAYECEEKLFVKSAYLTAMSQLDYRTYLNAFRERMEELMQMEMTPENQKHLNEELKLLRDMLLIVEKPMKHTFTGYSVPSEMILLTSPGMEQLTIDVMPRNVRDAAKAMRGGVRILAERPGELFGIRTVKGFMFRFCANPLKATDYQAVAAAIHDAGLTDYLKKRHEGDGPFYFRIDLRTKLVLNEKSQYVKRLAADLGVRQVRVVANKVRDQRDEDFVRSAVPEADFLGCIHYNPEIMDADRLGKSPYDFCPAAIEEIRKIKAIIDRD